jgi:hypothetical protein
MKQRNLAVRVGVARKSRWGEENHRRNDRESASLLARKFESKRILVAVRSIEPGFGPSSGPGRCKASPG